MGDSTWTFDICTLRSSLACVFSGVDDVDRLMQSNGTLAYRCRIFFFYKSNCFTHVRFIFLSLFFYFSKRLQHYNEKFLAFYQMTRIHAFFTNASPYEFSGKLIRSTKAHGMIVNNWTTFSIQFINAISLTQNFFCLLMQMHLYHFVFSQFLFSII